MSIAGRIEILNDLEALSVQAAELIANRIRESTGPFRLSLSGGSTPRGCYHHLAHLSRLPWDRVEIYQGDERFVPHDDPNSNYRMIRETLLKHVAPRGVFAMPTDGAPEAAAGAYEDLLRQQYGASRLSPGQPLFDLQLLGLGEDGHTASLIPGQPVLEDRAHWVAPVPQGRDEPRLTLTYPALESSRLILFLVSGAAKQGAMVRARAGDTAIPAGRLRPQGDVIWLADRAAAGA
ncbi:MAG TPA: 6-phosphogluconolactonase [Rhizomicrobium sp.]|jgi:6-phosphogluconolactonase|nr:6-phosphogluconolactonase [Rhizomicrobium sp.]